MTVTPSPLVRTTQEPQWTPRQRQVLDLLVKQRTNSQIATELGISLDGAKWHVSEVITKLGVDSREEAAEYWRHRNGLKMRFTRVAGGLFAPGVLKWGAGTAFVAGVIVVSAFVISAFSLAGGEDTDRAIGDQPGANPDVPGNPQPQPGPQNPVPNPTGETVSGVEVAAFSFGQPSSLPVPLTVIIEKGCTQCDAPAEALERVTLDTAGQPQSEEIFRAPQGYIANTFIDPNGKEHYVATCSRGYCGGVGVPTADAQSTLFRSTDGGTTWTEIAVYDGLATVAALTADGPLVNRSVFANGSTDYRYEIIGKSGVVRPPAGTEPETARGFFGWRAADGRTHLNLDGSVAFVLPDLGAHPFPNTPIRLLAVSPAGQVMFSWMHGTTPADLVTYIGVADDGELRQVFRAGQNGMDVGAWLSEEVVFGNAGVSPTDLDPASSNSNTTLHPVMYELSSGKVTPLELYGPVFGDGYQAERNRILGVFPQATSGGSTR